MSNTFAAHHVRNYSLRRNAPIPGIVTDSWIRFSGVELLVVEEVWNTDETRGTSLDGEIMNRVALYGVVDSVYTGQLRWFQRMRVRQRSDVSTVIAEVSRYNPRVVMLAPDRHRGGPIQVPLYSLAQQFDDLQQARVWLEGDPMLGDLAIRHRLDSGLLRLNSVNWHSRDSFGILPLK
jgi:hypothetical protein